MDIHTLREKKEIVRSVLKDIGDRPASRHLSLARTHLEDGLLRLDCELRVLESAPEKPVTAPEPPVPTPKPGKPLVESLEDGGVFDDDEDLEV